MIAFDIRNDAEKSEKEKTWRAIGEALGGKGSKSRLEDLARARHSRAVELISFFERD